MKIGLSKKITGILLCLAFIISSLCVPSEISVYAENKSSVSIDGSWWTIDRDTGTITWIPYDWKGGEIPSTLDGVKVRAIGKWALYNNDEGERDHLKEVIVPEGVTTLESGAFYRCHVETVILPDSLKTIEDQVFSGCSSLKKVILPKNVTLIGRNSFYGCTALSELTMPDKFEGLVEIGDRAFYGCSSLKTVTLGEGVTSIGSSAFADCYQLTSVTIPKSMKSIGNYAFDGCEALETVDYAGKESNISFGKDVYSDCLWLHPDFSAPYRTSIYYRNLMSLKLTGDYIQDAISIAASQEGYNEGRSFSDLDGMNRNYTKDYLKDYTEFNYYIGRPEWLWRPGLSEVWTYGGWCGQFCGWCLNMAGIPDEAHQYMTRNKEESVKWKDTVYAGGSYQIKPGDVLHMKEGHFTLVTTITEKKNSVVFGTWNGNWPGVVWHEFEYYKKDGTMVDRSWSNDDLTEILIYKPEVIENLPHYTVTFDANGGKTSQKTKDICEGAYFGIMPVPTRSGYVFDGWYTGKNGGTRIGAYRKAKNTGNITLYAHWTKGDGDNGSQTGSDDNGEACIDPASVKIKAKPASVKLTTLNKQDFTSQITVKGCDGKITYSNKTSGSLKKYVSVSKTGLVTVKKGAPKGTVKIRVTIKPTGGCEKITKTIKIKIK